MQHSTRTGEGVAPIYVGDDITDEHAFEALTGRGIVIFAGEPGYLAVASRTTAAAFQPDSIDAVERFLDMLAR